MKSLLWVFKTESRQAWRILSILFIVGLMLGFTLKFAIKTYNQISNLAHAESWDADLLILPKGFSLEDIRHLLVNGPLPGEKVPLLPRALYESTKDLTKDQLQLGAMLVLPHELHPEVLFNGDFIGITWIKHNVFISPLREQNYYRTTNWGNNVINCIWAKGDRENINKLKELIDQKSVAQAVWILDEQQKNQQKQDELLDIQSKILIVLLLSFIIIFYLLYLAFLNSLKKTLRTLRDLGYTHHQCTLLLAFFSFSYFIAPFVLIYLCL